MFNRIDMKVSVSRSLLLETLKTNRESHKKQWKEAMVGFREELKKELQEKLQRLENGKSIDLRFDNRRPEEHIKEYDDVIEMLEFSTSAKIEISHDQFRQYIKDDWDWKRDWSIQNNVYIASASTLGE